MKKRTFIFVLSKNVKEALSKEELFNLAVLRAIDVGLASGYKFDTSCPLYREILAIFEDKFDLKEIAGENFSFSFDIEF